MFFPSKFSDISFGAAFEVPFTVLEVPVTVLEGQAAVLEGPVLLSHPCLQY